MTDSEWKQRCQAIYTKYQIARHNVKDLIATRDRYKDRCNEMLRQLNEYQDSTTQAYRGELSDDRNGSTSEGGRKNEKAGSRIRLRPGTVCKWLSLSLSLSKSILMGVGSSKIWSADEQN